jgi:hypothetical protein
MNNRKLIDYLPPVIQSILEIAELMQAEQPEAEQLWEAANMLPLERLVNTATVYGLSRWETILNIRPENPDDLEARRQAVKSKVYFSVPYSLPWLQGWLEQQFGTGNVAVHVTDYSLYPAISPGEGISTATLKSVEEALNEIKPANIIVKMAFRFLHSLTIGHDYSSYVSGCPLCGTFECGTHPAT